jgi:integrase
LVFTYAGKRHYLSTGFQDTPTNRKLAEMKARQIELDILSENFDSTLAKYKPQVALSTVAPTVTPISEPQPSLAELWGKYTEFKTPSLSPSTIAKDYVRIENCINLLPAKFPRDAIAIRDWLIANKTPDTTR